MSVTLDGVSCKVICKGISYGVAPKIGSNALIIVASRVTGHWEIDLRGSNLPEGDYWYQLISNGQFIQGHGMVTHNGTITQWG